VVIVEELYFEPVKGILRVVSEETIEVFGVNSKETPAKKEEQPTKSTPKPKKVEERPNILSSLPKLDENHVSKKANVVQPPKANMPVNETILNTVQVKEGEGHEDLIRRIIEERKAKLEQKTAVSEQHVSEQKIEETPVAETVIVEEVEPEAIVEIEAVSEIPVTPTPHIDETVTPTSKSIVSENSIFTVNARKAKANSAVKGIIANINNPQPTPEVTGTVEPGKFFEELEELKKLNEKKAKNRAVKDAIEQSKTKK